MIQMIKKITASFNTDVSVELDLCIWQYVTTEFGCILCEKINISHLTLPLSLKENKGHGHDNKVNEKIFELKNIAVLLYLNTSMLNCQVK